MTDRVSPCCAYCGAEIYTVEVNRSHEELREGTKYDPQTGEWETWASNTKIEKRCSKCHKPVKGEEVGDG